MTDQNCSTCHHWQAPLAGSEPGAMWPFSNEKPAAPCKRGPPTGLWGSNEEERSLGIGQSRKTFHDDYCYEWLPR